jgi:hypothetical protein
MWDAKARQRILYVNLYSVLVDFHVPHVTNEFREVQQMAIKVTINRIFSLFLCLLLIYGCATPELKLSEKAEKKQYVELYLIPPDEDPRDVVPKVVSGLDNIGFKVKVITPDDPIGAPQGTGFVISNDGYILTCDHVISGEKMATIWLDGNRYEANVTGTDKEKDLCLLKVPSTANFPAQPVIIVGNKDYKMGQDVYTISYPLSNILGNEPRLSKGLISSTKGMKDNPDFLQISAEIQPGSSGGPLFDENGKVIGIVQQTLNPLHVLFKTGGALPQNVNFALKSQGVVEFVETYNVDLPQSAATDRIAFDTAQHSVVEVHAGFIPAGSENIPKIIAVFTYVSFWDFWYRFRVFHIEFYDFETGDLILKAGQYGDNMFSTEQKVIDATFEQIKAEFMAAK